MHTFVLTDADGVEHQYQILPHGAEDGERIMWQLDAMAVGPLAALLQSGIGQLVAGEASVGDVLDKDVASLFEGVDFAGVGRDLSKVLGGPDILALSGQLLRHTTRDGQKLVEGDKRTPAFQMAYQRNYWELRRALFEVIRYNRFFPLPGA